MLTILKIGYRSFLVKDNKQAAKAIEALAGMVALDSKYIGGDMREVFWPKHNDSKIGFETIQAERMLRCEPQDNDIEVETRLALPGSNRKSP